MRILVHSSTNGLQRYGFILGYARGRADFFVLLVACGCILLGVRGVFSLPLRGREMKRNPCTACKRNKKKGPYLLLAAFTRKKK